MQVERAQAGEVPAIWVPSEGPLVGGLTFRVGQGDEELPIRGTTHLIEHLALHDVKSSAGYNGATGIYSTSFYARGEVDEVGAVLQQVIHQLGTLPTARVPTEASVLRAEANQRQSGTQSLALMLRYGPQGPGLVELPELGLEHPSVELIDQWRQRYFTAQNAVLWFAGPTPPRLDTSPLRGGNRMSIRRTPSIVPFGRRSFVDRLKGILIDFEVERTTATSMAFSLVLKRLNDVLRTEHGLVYGIGGSLNMFDRSWGHGSISADCLPANLPVVHEALCVELYRFAYEGPTAEERREFLDQARRSTEDPAAAASLASGAAENELIGRDQPGNEEWLARMEACTNAELSAVVAAILENSLWLFPNELVINDLRYEAVPAWSMHNVAGNEYQPVPDVAEHNPDLRLFVGPEGVKVRHGTADLDDRRVTARFDNVAGVLALPDGVRILWTYEGFRLVVNPAEWKNGQDLPARIDAGLPAHLVVRREQEHVVANPYATAVQR